MKTHRCKASSCQRLMGSKWLSLALVTLLSVPSAGFAAPGTVSPPKFGAYAVGVPFAPLASVIEVNKTGDGSNVNANVGCDVDAATPGEQCTLRAAIQRAEVLGGDDTISFNIPTTEPDCVVASGACTINLTDGLQLSTNIAFVGPGADKLTVRRNTSGNYRVFLVLATGTVSFSGLTISNGNTTSVGGGILYASTGTVNVADCVVSENRASSGGGIANSSTGRVNITNSIIGGNSVVGGVPSRGGGILVNSGTVNVTNSIIGGNSIVGGGSLGGGIRKVSGTMNISNSTIAGNDGGGLYTDVHSPTTVKSTIIVQNDQSGGAVEVTGSFTSEGFNLIGRTDGSEGFTQPTDQTGTYIEPLDAKLTNVQIFGFPVLAQPLCDSPALDKGTSAGLNGTPTTDVRGAGFPRTIDDPDVPNAASGDGTDIGAFERAVCSHNQFTFTVNKTGDADDLNPGDLICDSDAGATGPQCTLRAAIEEANVVENDPNQSIVTRTINFAIPMTEPDCDAATGACIVNLTKGLPEVSASVSIEGPGAEKLTVRRNSLAAYRIFTISSLPEVVTISGLTVNNGFALDNGGGIAFFSDFSKPRVLNVVGCKLSDNHAGRSGGGIAAVNIGRATLNVTNSTISNNFTDAVPTGSNMGGGGIAFTGILGTLSITNSTISDNITTGDGGGLYTAVAKNVSITNSQFIGNQAEQANARGGGVLSIVSSLIGGNLNISNSHFTENRAAIGGGISLGSGSSEDIANITNSTFSGNTSNQNRGGGINLNRGTLNIINSTISNNRGNPSTTGSAGIHAEPDGASDSRTLNVTNSTIIGNDGGGINLFRGTLNVSNSTIIGGVAVGPTSAFGTWTVKSSIVSHASSGAFTSGGFNLIGDPGHPSTSTGFANGVNNDQVGTTAAPLDPKLDPAGLQNNGGPTQTIALQPDSPAIDQGTADGLTGTLTTDQRGTGFARTFDDPLVAPAADGTDIGAFEAQSAAPTVIVAAGSTLINESCPPANGAIDPGERVSVNLELINTGTTSTTNLVGTLQASGNVIAPGGPLNYGAIASGDMASRTFSFTANGTCGENITLSLQLQDGMTNLGTVIYSMTLGCNSSCQIARLVTTNVALSCVGGNVQAEITLQNQGIVSATGVTLTQAQLGSPAVAGAPVPQGPFTLAPGATQNFTVTFATACPFSGTKLLRLKGTSTDAGSWGSTSGVTSP